jgi:hypothetical protein
MTKNLYARSKSNEGLILFNECLFNFYSLENEGIQIRNASASVISNCNHDSIDFWCFHDRLGRITYTRRFIEGMAEFLHSVSGNLFQQLVSALLRTAIGFLSA